MKWLSGRFCFWALLAGLLALSSSSCGGEGTLGGPISLSGGGTGSGVGGAGGGAGALPVKRTIITRNPYGNVAAHDNLLWDGDFEWSSAFSDQYGWLTGTSPGLLSFALPELVVGSLCQSGIKCARLSSGQVLVGVGVASQGHELAASVWVNVGQASCSSVQVLLVSASGDEEAESLGTVGESTDSDGWCQFHHIAEERQQAIYLYLYNMGPDPVIVDNATVVPVGTAQRSATAGRGLDGEYEWLRREVRRLRQPRIVPSNRARKRWQGLWRGGR